MYKAIIEMGTVMHYNTEKFRYFDNREEYKEIDYSSSGTPIIELQYITEKEAREGYEKLSLEDWTIPTPREYTIGKYGRLEYFMSKSLIQEIDKGIIKILACKKRYYDENID